MKSSSPKPTPPGRRDSQEPSAEALILRIANHRDRDAFRSLFAQYGAKVKGYMRRLGAGSDLAEEAAQETMLAIWRRAETFAPERASAGAWIFAIARNKRIDLLRRGARPDPDLQDPTQERVAESSEAAAIAERRDAALRGVLSELSADQKRVVALAFYEGASHGEIAERLQVPLGTVKSRLRLAFTKLRVALGEDFKSEI